MVKIKHNKTGEVRKISRSDWERELQYRYNRDTWTIADPGDPVMLMRAYDSGSPSNCGLVDRDHAERVINSEKAFYYLELDGKDPSQILLKHHREIAGRLPRTSPPLVKAESRIKPTSNSKYTIWDKIKHISTIVGAFGTILTLLQQCSGK